MNNKKLKILTVVAMWIAALTGGICSIVMTIGGYLTDWGPGSGMHPPVWRIWLIAVSSTGISAYVGEFLVRKLAKLLLARYLSLLEISLKFFLILLVGSMAAFMASWEMAFMGSKLTGAIEGLDWKAVLFYTPLMSFIYGIPFSLGTSVIFAIIVIIYLRPRPIHNRLDA